MRKKGMIALICVLFLSQACLIHLSGSVTSSVSPISRLLVNGTLLVVSAAVDVSLIRYVMHSIDRATQAYAAQMSEELERTLARYQAETMQARQRTQEIGRTIASELEQARDAITAGDYEDASRHLRTGLSKASKSKTIPCDNAIVAAVLSSKERQCRNEGITMDAHVGVPECLPFPDTDIATILFNLVDNAMHECMALQADGSHESPRISVRLMTLAGQLLVEVENPCRPGKDQQLRVRRRQARFDEQHGLGMGIISSIAESHGGLAEFEAGDDRFVATVMLPLPTRDDDGAHDDRTSYVHHNPATQASGLWVH